MPRTDARRREVLRSHEHKGGCGYKTNDGWTQASHHALNDERVHVAQEYAADEHHYDERRKDECQRGSGAAEDGIPLSHAGILHGHVSAVSGRIDANGTRSHLTDRHNIGKLRRCEPRMMRYGLRLNERQHAVTSTESEESYLEKRNEEL